MSFHGRRGHSLEEPAGSRCVPHSDHARLSSASRTDMLPLSTQSLAHTSPRCFPFSFLPRHTAYLFTPWPVLHFFRSLVTCWPWEYLPITCLPVCVRGNYTEKCKWVARLSNCVPYWEMVLNRNSRREECVLNISAGNSSICPSVRTDKAAGF